LPAAPKLVDQLRHASHQPISESRIRPSIAKIARAAVAKDAGRFNKWTSEHNQRQGNRFCPAIVLWQVIRRNAWLALFRQAGDILKLTVSKRRTTWDGWTARSR
jgi:hypothetical protein